MMLHWSNYTSEALLLIWDFLKIKTSCYNPQHHNLHQRAFPKMWSTDPRTEQQIFFILIFSSNPQTFNDLPGQWELCLYTHSAHWQIHTKCRSTHTLTQCGSGRVCCHGSLLLQWCSGATLQPHTAPNVPALLLASRSHMGKEQPIWWEEHFVWIESLSALRTKEERCSDGKSLDFFSPLPY